MKFVNVTELSALGKSAIAFIITLGGLMQIPAIGVPLTAAAKNHPHFAAAIATVTMLTTLLSNPAVQKALGVTIEVPPDATVKQTTTITTPAVPPA